MDNNNDSLPEQERVVIGLEEEYSLAETRQLKIIAKQKREDARKARQEKRKAYKNTVKFRKKTRTAVLLGGGLALLIGVTLASVSLSQDTETPDSAAGNTSISIKTAEESAAQNAADTLVDVGGALYLILAETYGEDSDILNSIESSSQEEGTIVSDSRGESYIISGELSNLPADFDVDSSLETLTAPLQEDPLWNVEMLEETEDLRASLHKGDTFLKAAKFHGVNYTDGSASAITIIYSKAADNTVRVRVDSSALIAESSETEDKQ